MRVIIFAFVSLYLPFTYASSFHNLIITQGSGGDYYSGFRLSRAIHNSTLVSLGNSGIETSAIEHAKCIIIMGQGSANTILNSDQFKSNWLNKDLAIYTHLLGPSIIDFLGGFAKQERVVNLYTTDSQIRRLKENNKALYDIITEKHTNINVYTSPLSASSISDESINNKNAPRMDYAIWLGGDYVNSKNQRVLLSTMQISAALKRISTTLKPNYSVGIFLMPRIFPSQMTTVQKNDRIKSIVAEFPNSKVTLFASQMLLSQFEASSTTRVAPPYQELMISNWRDTKHFASVDQYNIFSDLKGYDISPFLLNPKDKDQQYYADSYLSFIKNRRVGKSIISLMSEHLCDTDKR